jgi:hypothetical protein
MKAIVLVGRILLPEPVEQGRRRSMTPAAAGERRRREPFDEALGVPAADEDLGAARPRTDGNPLTRLAL